MRRVVLTFVTLFLTGCLRPEYKRPPLPVAPEWTEPPATAQSSNPAAPEAADVKWREFFLDKGMRSVIELALANNRDLRVATLNVERTQALYRIQRAQQYPEIDASGAADIYQVPVAASAFGISPEASITPRTYRYELYNAGLGVSSWELDLFGRIRYLKRQALEQYFATAQNRSAAQISLIAAVANSYLALAGNRENLQLAKTTLETQQASYDLIRRTRDAGIGSDLDLHQAESQVEAARVDIARYTAQVALDENALDLLVGAPVSKSLLPNALGSDQALKDLSPGLPSEVLLRRPDILAAEHQLKGAYANIGAARAAFFPRIALTGSAGYMSTEVSDLFEGAAKTWSFAPQVVIPIFDAGARRASLRVSKVDRDIAIASYEKGIQTAFREVNDSLTLRTRLAEQKEAQEKLVNALDAAFRLSEARYRAGIDSYLGVLVAQRSLYVAQQGLVNVRTARLSNLVTLYKVLGGGA